MAEDISRGHVGWSPDYKAEPLSREIDRLRERRIEIEREEEAAEERLAAVRLAEASRPVLPAVPWDRLLPRERDAAIDALHELVGALGCGSDSQVVYALRRATGRWIEALRVAADVLSRKREAD